MATKRILKELTEIVNNPPFNFSVGIADDHDLYHWQATMIGPEDSLYAGGLYFLDITFPMIYPFNPPKITFLTKIYHPRVSFEGKICFRPLEDGWTPASTVSRVLSSLFSLLYSVEPDEYVIEPQILDLYNTDQTKYERTVREWNRIYAR